MGTRILLVEDDPSSQDLIRALCESRGDSVDTAADGFGGLRLLSERRHEIVLIDYHLPEMDGYALARLIRELARPEGAVRLVGITADRHGLASRRGADTLFDAILVKPLDPRTLFATLDRLTQPVLAVAAGQAADPAAALWQRRRLSGRPRALLCPPPSAAEAEAVAQAFDLAKTPAEADIVLIRDEAGLDDLREFRADGPAALLPAFDLTGRLGAACDGVFGVGDADSWTALAATCLAFAGRRARLSGFSARDPKARLAALMVVADRSITLASDTAVAGAAYVTGFSPTSLMRTVLQLMEAGALTCKPVSGGVTFDLTHAGREAVVERAETKPSHGRDASHPREATSAAATAAAPDRPVELAPGSSPARLLDLDRLRDLDTLIGTQQVEALLARLGQTLDEAFAPGSDRQAIARQAHTLIAAAGSLGFEQLSQVCLSLQEAIAAGSDETRCLSHARIVSQETRSLCIHGTGLLSA